MIRLKKETCECRCCGNKENVISLFFSAPNSPTSTFVPLCNKCRKELTDKLLRVEPVIGCSYCHFYEADTDKGDLSCEGGDETCEFYIHKTRLQKWLGCEPSKMEGVDL